MKDCTFYLGPAANLDSRRVQVFAVDEWPADLITDQTVAAATETFDLALEDDRRFQLILTDRRSGEDLTPTVYDFNTTDESVLHSGTVMLLSWDDLSESSVSSFSSSSITASASSVSSVSSSSLSSSSSSVTNSSSSSSQTASDLSSSSSLSSSSPSSSSSSLTESSSSSASSLSSSTQP